MVIFENFLYFYLIRKLLTYLFFCGIENINQFSQMIVEHLCRLWTL
jgi:hypothetical protein